MDSTAAFIGRFAPAAKQPKPKKQKILGQLREISFTIPGLIGGKARPRFSMRQGPGGPIAHAYTPLKTKSDEAIVRHYAHDAVRESGLLHGPLELTMHVVRTCPASWSQKKKAAAHWITGKPDADNSIKLAGDAMNGIVYGDDAQISCVSFHRTYGAENSVHITVSELT
jgi:Holliday junction resolvase RusA-like endonuclease